MLGFRNRFSFESGPFKVLEVYIDRVLVTVMRRRWNLRSLPELFRRFELSLQNSLSFSVLLILGFNLRLTGKFLHPLLRRFNLLPVSSSSPLWTPCDRCLKLAVINGEFVPWIAGKMRFDDEDLLWISENYVEFHRFGVEFQCWKTVLAWMFLKLFFETVDLIQLNWRESVEFCLYDVDGTEWIPLTGTVPHLL